MVKIVMLAIIILFSSCISFRKKTNVIDVLNSIEFIDSTSVSEDLNLPVKVDGVDIEWSNSSHPEILTVNGSVFRPSLSLGDTVVTIDASCTINKINYVKSFEFTVKAYGKKSEEINILNSQVKMLYIPNGEYEKSGGRITITRDYYISEFLVDSGLYFEVMNSLGIVGNKDTPVTNISWEDANIFCRKLSIYTGIDFRLPTETELEYAEKKSVLRNKEFYIWSSDRFSDPFISGENPSVKASCGDYILIRKGEVRDYQYSLDGRDNLGFRLAFNN